MWILLSSLFLIFGSVTSADDENPSFSWSDSKFTPNDVPYLNIQFPDGSQDSAILDYHNPIPIGDDEKISSADLCIFKGYLLNEKNSFVTLTGGCPYDDTFDISFNSKHLNSSMFKVIDGLVQVIPSAFTQPRGRSRGILSNRPEVAFDKAVYPPGVSPPTISQILSGRRALLPLDGFKIKIKVYFDQAFKSRFAGNSNSTLRKIISHAQNVFSMTSLPTPMALQILGVEEIPMTLASADTLDTVKQFVKDSSANTNVFLTNHYLEVGLIGLAWMSTICDTNMQFRTAVIEYYKDDLRTGQTVAHEIGHNLGMPHDFGDPTASNPKPPKFDSTGKPCTNIGGVMDYDQASVTQWSQCSIDAFLAYYDKFTEDGAKAFCLDAMDSGTNPLVDLPIGGSAPAGPPEVLSPAAAPAAPDASVPAAPLAPASPPATMPPILELLPEITLPPPPTTLAPIPPVCVNAPSCLTTCSLVQFTETFFCRASQRPVTYCRCSLFKTPRALSSNSTVTEICDELGESCFDVCASVGFHKSFGCQIISPVSATCGCSQIKNVFDTYEERNFANLKWRSINYPNILPTQ